jgi:hypothetical protein
MEKMLDRDAAEPSGLCYLDAAHIQGPLMDFEGVEVRNRHYGRLGRLDGIVLDPAEGQVRYLVVKNERSARRRPFLVPFDTTQLDVEHRELFVDEDDVSECEEFDRDRFRSFSPRRR